MPNPAFFDQAEPKSEGDLEQIPTQSRSFSNICSVKFVSLSGRSVFRLTSLEYFENCSMSVNQPDVSATSEMTINYVDRSHPQFSPGYIL